MSKPATSPRQAAAEASSGPTSPSPGALHPKDAAFHAATMIPAQLLQPGEIIVLLLKPHPLYIFLACLKTLTILLLLAALGIMLDNKLNMGGARQNLVVLSFAAIAGRVFWQVLEWLSRVYVMTDQRVITVAGVLRVRVFESPLNQITHSEMSFSLRERIFMLGTLSFFTAGTAVAEASWHMVSKPLDVHQKVVETLRRYRR